MAGAASCSGDTCGERDALRALPHFLPTDFLFTLRSTIMVRARAALDTLPMGLALKEHSYHHSASARDGERECVWKRDSQGQFALRQTCAGVPLPLRSAPARLERLQRLCS